MLGIINIILKKQKYLLIASLSSLLMFVISYYLTVANIVNKNLISYAEMNGYVFTIVSTLLALIISLMFGLYLSMIIFRRDIIKNREKISEVAGAGGITFGVLAAGCPTCGAPLLGLLGAPLGLMSLPLDGIELKVLSIVLIYWSLYLIANNIEKSLACQFKNNLIKYAK